MQRSTERILTTQAGSLVRPPDLVQLILEREEDRFADGARLEERVRSATAEVVRNQVACGIDVVNDGELGKPGFSTYVKDRLSGFEGEGRGMRGQAEAADFPEYYARLAQEPDRRSRRTPACTGPVALRDPDAVHRDIANLQAAVEALGDDRPADVFMTAASPGVIAQTLENQHYPSYETYLAALIEAMRPEYEAIAAAGIVLQLDCPDLAMCRAWIPNHTLTTEQFRDLVRLHVEALNAAVANIPPEQMRLHVCWGNHEAPHRLDIPLQDIIDVLFLARPSALSIEAANPRHAHEWTIFQDVKLPDGKLLIPGVIDSTTNYVEHPELVAQRITNLARLVGRENVIAGSDCGFGTFAARTRVDGRVMYAKFGAMAEGTKLASATLW